LDKKETLTDEEKELLGKDPHEFFDNLMENVEINRVKSILSTSGDIRYYPKDFDRALLTPEDETLITQYAEELGMFSSGEIITFEQLHPSYKKLLLDEDEMKYMNFQFWLSLRRKGHLMIDAYKEDIIPRIEKIYGIEKTVNLVCGEDSFIGYIDMICDYRINEEQAEILGKEENDIVKVLYDHKTSSVRYPKNKILKDSQQLSLYEYCEQVGLVGYIVAVKNMKTPKRGKRVGETFCDIQVLINEIPEETQEIYVDLAGETLYNIEEGNFEPNPKNCFKFQSLCPYHKICQEGGTDESYLHCGLEK
jgi:hypothetical protein